MDPSSNPSGTLPFDPFAVIVSSPATGVAPFSLPPSSTVTLSTPAAAPSRPAPGFSGTPTPGFGGLSPSPSTPAQQGFNPDDFFASPPQPPSSCVDRTRFTPELKRRLFGPADPLLSAPSTARKGEIASSLGLTTPIPTAAFANPLSNDGLDDGEPELRISPAFSPARALLGEVVPPPPTQQLQQHKPTFQPFSARELAKVGITALPARGPTPLPGTPFTPASSQKTKCSCKASKCLKLYCPCFASSGFCGADCTCRNCQNSHITAHSVREARETVLARDPRAFEPKVRNSLATASGDIHTKGCNCRKGCSKNYCVCRELRVDCGPRCTCSGPNGCLNGKTDALEDHQFKGKAEHILGTAKSRLSPCHLRGDFPPTKSIRVKSASGGRVKHDRKRQKLETPTTATARPGTDEIANVLSPSFPSFSFSPATGMKENIDEFTRIIAEGGEEFLTPFSMRKDPQNQPKTGPDQNLEFRENRKGGRVLETPTNDNALSGADGCVLTTIQLPNLSQPVSSQVSAGPSDGKNAFDTPSHNPTAEAGKENNMNVQNDEQISNMSRLQAVNKKRRPSPVKLETEFDEVANETQYGSSEKKKTPERRRLAPDIEAASSPTTDGKDAASRTWGTLRGSLFGKEEKIEVCRLPRILRVKMGSGRLLGKFEM